MTIPLRPLISLIPPAPPSHSYTSWVRLMLAYTYTKPPLQWRRRAWQVYTNGASSCLLAPESLNQSMNPPLPPSIPRYVKCMTASGRLAPHAKPPQQTSLRGRAIRLHPNLYEKRTVSVEEIRQVFRLITQGMSQFKIGTTAQTGLLVMTNKTEVKAALDTRPPTATTQHIQIENVVTVAGATARHGLILQFNIGFLSGNSQNMTEDTSVILEPRTAS